MQIKEQPNHRVYIEILRRMTPEQRLRKALELSDFSRSLFAHGLRRRFADLDEAAYRTLLLLRLDKCHNRNY